MNGQREQIKIGQLFCEAGVISTDQLNIQLQVAKTIGQPLGQILLRSGLVTKYQLICAVQVQSMILDKILNVESGAHALKLVCVEGLDLSDACAKVGFQKDKTWTCKLGELLVGAGILTPRQLLDAIAISFQSSVPLGQTLVRGKSVRPEVIAAGLNLQKQVRSGMTSFDEAVASLRRSQAESTGTAPIKYPDPAQEAMKTPLEMTGEFQAGTLEQVDQVLWKRIRKEKLQQDDPDDSPQQAAQELIGTILANRYEVISFIGSGGMSFVYMVRNRALDQVLALKMMQPRLRRDQEMIRRFKQEAQAVSSLDHPNVVAIHDFGVTDEGRFFLVMDYVPGVSLAELLFKENRLPVARALPILIQACDAIAHAHERGIIHRDLKPGNIMLSTSEDHNDRVKIVDFGIAKLQPAEGLEDLQATRSGELFGSPLYMSPERCMGRPLDGRSDIYSIGCLMYETLTGHPPFLGTTIYEIFYKHMQQKPAGLGKIIFDKQLCQAIETVILTCLAKSPDNRFQSISQLKEELERIFNTQAALFENQPEERTFTLIGDLLEKADMVCRAVLNERLKVSKALGQPLGQTLLQAGDLTDNQVIATVQVQSLIHDGVLTIEQAVETLNLVTRERLCLEEALEKIGLLEENWTNKLGELLSSAQLVNKTDLHKALYLSLRNCRPLGHVLVQEGMLKPVMTARALSVQKRIRSGLLSQEEGLNELKLDPADVTLFL
jgi:serine/threonine-protein kinase